MVLRHTYAATIDDCTQFRGSKYVQSEIQKCYSEAKKYLQEGRKVVFSGTPCQIAGLYGFLGGDKYDNLITVDLVCRGVPSPLLLRKFLLYQSSKIGSDVVDYRSRDKHYGYSYSTSSIWFRNKGKLYHKGKESDLMLGLYFKDLISRPCCYKCHFKTVNRMSDITIFDCWDAPSVSKEFSSGGATNVFIHSDRGNVVFNNLKQYFIWAPSEINSIIKRDGIMLRHRVSKNPRRSEFFNDLKIMTIPQIEFKYNPKGIARQLGNMLKPFLFSIGVFGLYMRLKAILNL